MARYINIGLIALVAVAGGLTLINRVYYDPERVQASNLYKAYLNCLDGSVGDRIAALGDKTQLAETALVDCSDESLAYSSSLRSIGHSPDDVANIEKTFMASAKSAVNRHSSASTPH